MFKRIESSIYSCGEDKEMTQFILDKFKINVYDCPRFRSWEIDMKKPLMKIRGRYGGGNREEYELEISRFKSKYDVINDEDDDFDCTYACFNIILDKDEWLKFKNIYGHKKVRGGTSTEEYINNIFKNEYAFCPECARCYEKSKMIKCPTCNKLFKHKFIKGAYYCDESCLAPEILGSDYEECYKCNKKRMSEESESEEDERSEKDVSCIVPDLPIVPNCKKGNENGEIIYVQDPKNQWNQIQMVKINQEFIQKDSKYNNCSDCKIGYPCTFNCQECKKGPPCGYHN